MGGARPVHRSLSSSPLHPATGGKSHPPQILGFKSDLSRSLRNKTSVASDCSPLPSYAAWKSKGVNLAPGVPRFPSPRSDKSGLEKKTPLGVHGDLNPLCSPLVVDGRAEDRIETKILLSQRHLQRRSANRTGANCLKKQPITIRILAAMSDWRHSSTSFSCDALRASQMRCCHSGWVVHVRCTHSVR